MNIMRNAGLLFALLLACWSHPAWSQAGVTPDEVEEEGVIHELVVEANSLIISGVSFRVAYDARVQIRGTYGAFTLLRPGMKVKYLYRDYGDDREIFEIEQLPDNTVLEEV